MDRNNINRPPIRFFDVALRKESVDRNTMSPYTLILIWLVALRKESVDRNDLIHNLFHPVTRSLSARRAWIEIYRAGWPSLSMRVALRKESVDRNTMFRQKVHYLHLVALRKESVDRNYSAAVPGYAVQCRSPQGERG